MTKTNRLIALFITLLFLSSNVFAKPINVQTARTVALNFYKLNPNALAKSNLAVVLNYTQAETDSSVDFYVFDIYPLHSFVIVSGNDIVNPVIAYSTESYFTADVSSKEGVSDWVKETSGKIHYAVLNGLTATSQIQNKWTAYINGNNSAATRGTGAGPLLTTNWNQEPYFNALCPLATDGTGEQCVTGCVATAMAQIMKFWNYPNQGTGQFSYNEETNKGFNNNIGTLSVDFGTTTYNWFNMPTSLNGNNTDIATLMYQCGVAVTMDYGDDNQGGSGSFVLAVETPNGYHSAQYAYPTYFLYNPKTLQGVQEQSYNSTQWISMMENEINDGRPVQYEGQDINGYGGHTWVLDGYDANDLVHMNWGWGGADNGYFEVDNLNPEVFNFDADDGALIGIEPLSTVQVTATATKAVICKGLGTTTLSADGPKSATYTWSPAAGLTCSTCMTTNAAPSSTTTYILKVDSSGVIATLSLIVNVATGISSSFTPDVTSVCSTPASVSFTNLSDNAISYLWEFGDGTTSTSASPTHTYNSTGNYTVKLIATGACGIDSIIKNNLISVNNNPPTANDQSVCRNQTATLSASATGNNGTLNWYSAPAGGSPVGSGNTFITPDIYAPTTYYVEQDKEFAVDSCSPADYTLGQVRYHGGFFTNVNIHSIIFNCFKAQTLVSVDVYAKGESNRTIELSDSLGNVIASQSFDIPNGGSTVALNYPLSIGNNYKLSCSGNVYLYRDSSGAAYPYYSPDSSVVLTNSDAGLPGYYYYFYNWHLQLPGCQSSRIPVNVSLLNPGTEFTTQITGTTVKCTPANPSATSFAWNFGDGNYSVEEDPTHTYATGGSFTIQLNEAGICTDTFKQKVDLSATGIENINAIDNLSLMPNPVSGNLTMEASVSQAGDGYMLNITNMLGETVITQNVQLNNGSNQVNIDVSSLAAGMYLFRLSGKDGQVAAYRKFVKD